MGSVRKKKQALPGGYQPVGFCGECVKPIEAIQPGGLQPRHVESKAALCRDRRREKPAPAVEVICRQVFRIGVQTLWSIGGIYYLSIENRTYKSTVEIPEERVPLWVNALTYKQEKPCQNELPSLTA